MPRGTYFNFTDLVLQIHGDPYRTAIVEPIPLSSTPRATSSFLSQQHLPSSFTFRSQNNNNHHSFKPTRYLIGLYATHEKDYLRAKLNKTAHSARISRQHKY
jgi:hypothetical protein